MKLDTPYHEMIRIKPIERAEYVPSVFRSNRSLQNARTMYENGRSVSYIAHIMKWSHKKTCDALGIVEVEA